MLAIIFGLSSDYEVFVVSRIKEDYTTNGDARRAVQRGTGLSARVVTAAALIMFSIFVAFMFTNDPTIKAVGFSFAAGVPGRLRRAAHPGAGRHGDRRVKALVRPQWFARHIPDPDLEGQRLAHKPPEQELAAAGTSARQGKGRSCPSTAPGAAPAAAPTAAERGAGHVGHACTPDGPLSVTFTRRAHRTTIHPATMDGLWVAAVIGHYTAARCYTPATASALQLRPVTTRPPPR